MNRILNNEIEQIKEYFANEKISDISVVVTGSVARGDNRRGDKGLNSDLDILVIIERLDQVEWIRKNFEKLTIYFKQKTSFILTLKENFITSRNRGYVRSIKNLDNILYDDLGIRSFLLKNLSTPIDQEEIYKSHFQEFCYYYSKWLETKDLFQKEKSLRSWEKICRMTEQTHNDKDFPSYDTVKKLLNMIGITLLPSSEKFLSAEFYGKEGTFAMVQNMVHIENQGIEASRSSVMFKYYED